MGFPTDEELQLWLRDSEHSFTERKVFSDSKDWLKTVVGFANSAPIDYPSVLYIGAKNDGTPEEKGVDLDSVQKSLSAKLRSAYPEIYYTTKILHIGGAEVLAVIVPGSPNRPHFAGPAYIRNGSETVVASKAQFEALIAMRNSKAYTILEWKGKLVTLGTLQSGHLRPFVSGAAKVVDCNSFYVTLEVGNQGVLSSPIGRIELAYDDNNQRLFIVEKIHGPVT